MMTSPKWESGAKDGFAWFTKYDTVGVFYRLKNDNEIYQGYKRVYKHEGYYVDDNTTTYIFFDKTRKRITNVVRFAIKIWYP